MNKMLKKDNDGYYMTTSFSQLLSYKNRTSSAYLMLSELIDNSIASWEIHNEDLSNVCNVHILIDNLNHKIEVSDNAYGMNKSELAESILINNENLSKKNEINMFGVGMKQCAFWFAEDLKIKTNSMEKKKFFYTEIITSDLDNEQKNKVARWKVKELKQDRSMWKKSKSPTINKSGTTIILENIYDDKKIWNKSRYDELKKKLHLKFIKYITSEELEITITMIRKEGSEFKKFNEKITNNDVVPQLIKDEYKKTFLNLIDKKLDPNKLLVIKDLKEIIIKLVDENKPLEFVWNYKPKFIKKNKQLSFVIGIQSEIQSRGKKEYGYKHYYGLMTFQHNRAINIPDENVISLGDYIRDDIKRVYVRVELGEHYSPDDNKREFNYGDDKELFKEFVKSELGKDLNLLAESVAETLKVVRKETKVKRNNPKGQENIISDLNKNAKENSMWSISKRNIPQFEILVNNDKYQFLIMEEEINNKKSSKWFILCDTNPKKKNVFKIHYNINHPIWDPVIKSATNRDLKFTIYSLMAIIGISQFSIEEENLANAMSKNPDYSKKNISEIMSEISKRIGK